MLLPLYLLPILSLNCLCSELHSNNPVPKIFNLMTRCCSPSSSLGLMKDSIPLNENYRMCRSSCDLNYTKNNLCDFVKNDVNFAEI